MAWLGPGSPRSDKVLSPLEASKFLNSPLVVEEKVDGTNVGISLASPSEGELIIRNRGTRVGPGAHPQFRPLWPWLDQRRHALAGALGEHLTLFGEWCFAVHSIRYDLLPDFFLVIDVLDQRKMAFWDTTRRNKLADELSLSVVPELARGRFTLAHLREMVESGSSRLGNGPLEGVYLRREQDGWLQARTKLVSAAFVHAISEHWMHRPLERNTLAKPMSSTTPI